MGKRDRDKKVRATAQVWMRQQKPPQTPADIANRTGIAAQRITEWLADDQKQLDLSEQAAVMAVVGLKESDMPEVLVHDFRKSGYLPEVLVNFLALLGWNPGGDRERMTVKELIELFRLEDIGKSNSSFNREKLLAFNTEVLAHAAAVDIPRLIAAFRDFLAANPESSVNAATDEQVARLVKMKPGMRTLRDVEEQSRFFFIPDEKIVYDPAAVEKVLKKGDGQGLAALKALLPILEAIPEIHWTHVTIEPAVTAYATAKGLGLGKVAQPLRVAISGGTISPPIFESLEFLGRARTWARIRRCLAGIG
jgi:glutamyl/glutaminyl-tRNA synthetase